MFQSYSCKYYDLNQKSQQYNCEITIVDEDFQETTAKRDWWGKPIEAYAEEVISIYSKRNLNVSKNIIAFMKYNSKNFGSYYNLNNQIQWYKKDIENFNQYLPEIEKYLMLE